MGNLISFAAFQLLGVVNVSKNRNLIGHSDYVAHLGKHVDFFDKVIEVLPTQSPLVFICDGAKWIWKWIEEYYQNVA